MPPLPSPSPRQLSFIKLCCILGLCCFYWPAAAQTSLELANTIRVKYGIPELAFAVVSADSIFEMHTLGVQRIHTRYGAKPDDRFHIGSNTKAITSFLAALLVEQGKASWEMKFFDLFPGLKKTSKKTYYNITLQDLLTFRARLPSYTYTFPHPTKDQIRGDEARQRLELAKYFLRQSPMKAIDGLTPSNADYVLAGLMLERIAKKTFKELVNDFGRAYQIYFGFDYPNLTDTLQPWGHDAGQHALPPADNYKLNWLLSAGNLNVSLPDYIKFIQLQLKGLKGKAPVLNAQTFCKLLYGLPNFSFGWFNQIDETTAHHIAYNEGNAGAFITRVKVIKEAGMAYIVFTNSASEQTTQGVSMLMSALEKKWGD
ncbi:MAG: serine hydrolase [Williamsia sp.]|nr:serine hydrolase [Williamsia sp.]